jgi:predicted MFS family arabinose efflux permease
VTDGRATYEIAFLIDAATFLVSFLAIRPLRLDDAPAPTAADEEAPPSVTFRATLRLPLIRALMPSLGAAVVGAGTVFSLGVIFVHRELDAGDVGFGVLVVLFGVGGSAGIGWLRFGNRPVTLALVGSATTVLGLVLAAMSLLSSLPIAYVAAALFGAAGAIAIVGALTVLQEQLDGDERTMGLAVAHTVFRFGMGTSAIVAGVVADHIPPVEWWLVGVLRPAAIVMFGAGGLIAVAGLMVPRSDRPPESRRRLA